jgi:enoyl-CoA hydratase/carnithine racemase
MVAELVGELVQTEKRGQKFYITLNRPESLNALTRPLLAELGEAVREYEEDDTLRVAILSGAGDRAFSVGGDLKGHTKNAADKTYEDGQSWPAVRFGRMVGYQDLEYCEKPVIAAIDGWCLAGGFELSLCADIRVATSRSKFGLPEPRRAMLGGPGLHILSRSIPLGEALLIQLTGGHMAAERAYQIGLVQALADDKADLTQRVDSIADEIIKCSPYAVRSIKTIVKIGRNLPSEYSWRIADPYQEIAARSHDALEGPKAFVEKRDPVWYVGREMGL